MKHDGVDLQQMYCYINKSFCSLTGLMCRKSVVKQSILISETPPTWGTLTYPYPPPVVLHDLQWRMRTKPAPAGSPRVLRQLQSIPFQSAIYSWNMVAESQLVCRWLFPTENLHPASCLASNVVTLRLRARVSKRSSGCLLSATPCENCLVTVGSLI